MSRKYSEALVLRVNELFYDLLDDRYDAVHAEMTRTERRRWREQVARYISAADPQMIADIGSGAGLVGLTILDMLKDEDTFICADLSGGMLERARAKLMQVGFDCTLDFRKIERTTPIVLPFEDSTVDIVTMNSVLHHVENTEEFLNEIDRILKPGGVFLIGHEPNRRFVESVALRVNYAAIKALLMPRHTIIKASHRAGLYPLLSRLYRALRPTRGKEAMMLLRKINAALRQEGLIQRDLTFEEIAGITDIRDSEGFDPRGLLRHFELLSLETYNHMLLISIKHGHRPLVRRYEAALARRYPDRGATFFAVLRKKRPSSQH